MFNPIVIPVSEEIVNLAKKEQEKYDREIDYETTTKHTDNNDEVGMIGEEMAMKYLRENGYEVKKEKVPFGQGDKFDLKVKINGKWRKIEVKTRNYYNGKPRPDWNFPFYEKEWVYKIYNYRLHKGFVDLVVCMGYNPYKKEALFYGVIKPEQIMELMRLRDDLRAFRFYVEESLGGTLAKDDGVAVKFKELYPLEDIDKLVK